MSRIVNVSGATLIYVDTGSANALEGLGYSVNGVEVELRGYFGDVPGDEHGGDQGPPIDVQYFGEIAIVRFEMSKYDSAIAAKCEPRLLGGTAGQPGASGTLMFGDEKVYRLLLYNTGGPLNFPRAFPRGSIEVNKGTVFSRYRMEWECHKDASGVLFNASTTGVTTT